MSIGFTKLLQLMRFLPILIQLQHYCTFLVQEYSQTVLIVFDTPPVYYTDFLRGATSVKKLVERDTQL